MSLAEIKFYSQNPSMYKLKQKGFNIKFYKTLIGSYYQQLGIKTILDIGANTGQSVITFRQAFPEATIHAFEPLPDCFNELSINVSGIEKVELHNIAVSDQAGILGFEQNEFSPSSSALPMTKEHMENFPFTKNSRNTKVTADTLDNILSKTAIEKNLLIKIDVQGYEKHVINGGLSTFSSATLIIMETTFETMYRGEPLFNEIYETMHSIGFKYAGAFDQLLSPQTNKILQQDAIFVKI